jgi:hypothetical protein
VNRGHAVRAVRTDDGEIGHADLTFCTLFDQARALQAAFIAGEPLAHLTEELPVDLIDDLEVSRQHPFKPRDRPSLQRFRQ